MFDDRFVKSVMANLAPHTRFLTVPARLV